MILYLPVLLFTYGIIIGGAEDYKLVEDKEESDRFGPNMSEIPPGLTKMKFKAPNLTDEEYHSIHMPASLKCDGCVIIAYQLNEVFDTFNKKHPSMKKMIPTSDILTLTELACNHGYEEYGIKEINGVKRMSGPAIPEAQKEAGMMQGGGRWPRRIQSMCKTMVGELDEEEIYERYKSSDLKSWLCYGSEPLRDACNFISDHKATKSKKAKLKTRNEL